MGAIRALTTNPFVKQDLSTNQMDSKVFISMRELSQILEASVNDSHQIKTILTTVERLSTSPEITDEPKSQEQQKYVLYGTAKEADTLGITFKGEQSKIKECSTWS